MPIYEYRCSSCGAEHEVLQKFSDPPLAVCPSCQKSTLSKLVSAAGFQLKGSGWYATDFKNGSKPAPKTSGADGKTDTADGKAATTETKGDGGSADSKTGDTKSEAAAPGPAARTAAVIDGE
ncbi:MAG TPA: zinc ribbon domain-containing protein [Casimicrobiaceae bacterium]|jgi:putative FmdB family regulatory protein